jgi:hypothetical protein
LNQDHLLIGATFTANALEGYLLGNAQFRDCAQSVSFIPSSQLLQTLLSDPKQDRPARLIVMLRLSDLLRHERIDGPGWQARLDETRGKRRRKVRPPRSAMPGNGRSRLRAPG